MDDCNRYGISERWVRDFTRRFLETATIRKSSVASESIPS
jgi:hypothetical protein